MARIKNREKMSNLPDLAKEIEKFYELVKSDTQLSDSEEVRMTQLISDETFAKDDAFLEYVDDLIAEVGAMPRLAIDNSTGKPIVHELHNPCCICTEWVIALNNAQPVADGDCCDKCNFKVVVPARLMFIKDMYEKKQNK